MGITPTRMAVIGGGISGLSTAWRLKKNGNDVTLFEAAKSVGGKIGTIYSEGFELDLGPVTISETMTLHALISELGLEVIEASDVSKIRYIYSKGRLHRVGPNPMGGSLLSIRKVVDAEGNVCERSASRRNRVGICKTTIWRRSLSTAVQSMMNGILCGRKCKEPLKRIFCFQKNKDQEKIIGMKGGFKTLTQAWLPKVGKVN